MGGASRAGHPRWAGPLAALLVISFVVYLLHRELAHFNARHIIAQLHAIPARALCAGFAFTAVSYVALAFYDVLGFAYLGKRLHFLRVLSASFIANAFGNNVGFAAFTGAAFRLRLYSGARLTATDVATMSGYTSVTTTLGLASMAGLSFLLAPDRAPHALHVTAPWSVAIGSALLLMVGSYFLWACSRRMRLEIRGWLLRPPGARLAAAQIALGTVDVGLTGAVLWMLLPDSVHIGYASFIGIFAVAAGAGFVAHAPGGIGVLEAIMLYALPGAPADTLLGSLLAYRCVYYLSPLLLATLLFGAEEFGAQWMRLAEARQRAATLIAPVVPSVCGALTFIAGAVLILAGVTPFLETEPSVRLLPLAALELAHALLGVLGLALLVLSRALFHRIRTAYRIASGLLLAGAVLALLDGFAYDAALVLAMVLAVLTLGRGAFHRATSIRAERFTPAWAVGIVGVVVASIWIGFLTSRHAESSSELMGTLGLYAETPRLVRSALIVSVLTAGYLIYDLLRAPSRTPARAGSVETEQTARLVEQSSSALANAALIGDKLLIASDSGNAFVMYRPEGRSHVALGDPIGPRADAEELIWRFCELADAQGARPVFYQTSAACLPQYLDLGLAAMTIGEEARLPLGAFSLEAEEHAELRTAQLRASRDRTSFEVVDKARVPALLPELRGISDAWLEEKAATEKHFSVGAFVPQYLRRFSIALLRRDGAPVAFANLWAARRAELAVDFMRFGPDSPPGAMDYLLLELMLWARAQGFASFSLGVAPLAHLEQHPLAPAWQRIGCSIFRHGEHFANFESLRRFMAKFQPHWEPRYLVAPGDVALPQILVDVSKLIVGRAPELVT